MTPSPSTRNADPRRDVAHPVVLEGDAEAVRRLGVPVGEERKVEVERLHPGDVRVRRVARDRERLDPRRLQLLSPVTQELELARSGRGPVEEIEEEQERPVVEQVTDRCALARRRPYHRLERSLCADLEHVPESTQRRARAPAPPPSPRRSRARPRRCRLFVLKTWSWRSAPLPRRRISSMPASSSSEPSSRACGRERLQRPPDERGHREPVAVARCGGPSPARRARSVRRATCSRS